MRPIDKGTAPRAYTNYQHARNDLCERIGWYCSYCEMNIRNMPEVEHVIPVANNGDLLDWSNFLISCKYCNVKKKHHNQGRINYLWPDQDNTFRALKYSFGFPVESAANLTAQQEQYARASIELCGLNREPGAPNEPTERDTRWSSRLETWCVALESYDDWIQDPSVITARHIARTATGHGHFSIWMTVFGNDFLVKEALIRYFSNTANNCFDTNYNAVARPGGNV
jgi:hypothetical protein